MIDFAAIADQFRGPLLAQTAPTVLLFERLAKAVKHLVTSADQAERATRGYPILRYRDGAVGVRLALGPLPVLTTVTDPGVAEGLRRRGTGFLSGLDWYRTAVRQELAPTEVAGAVLGALRAVADSLDRHAAATPAMFDARRAVFSDIFGLLNLGWSSLLGPPNQAQIRQAAQGGLAGAELADIILGLLPPDPPALAALTGVARLQEKLDEKAKLFLDLILLLPVLGLAADVLVHEGGYAAQHRILVELSKAESQVYDLRAAVVDFWLAGFGLGSLLHCYVAAADLVVGMDAVLFTAAVPGWCRAVLDAVDHLLLGIRYWGVWAQSLVRLFQVATTDLMAVDLMPWIAANTLPGWLASRLPLPRLTLDDVVAYASGEGDPAVRDHLVGWLSEAEDLLALVPGGRARSYREKLAALRVIVGVTLAPTPFTLPPDVLPSGPLGTFPNVYDAFFGAGRRADLLEAVRRLGVQTRASVVDTLVAGADLALGLAQMSAAEGERQAQFGAGLAIARHERQTRGIAADLLGPLRADVTARATGRDELAGAFEQAVAGGGIAVAAAAVPAFVGEMRRFWAARADAVPRPTSAHILARHGRLGMVRTPRLTVHAEGHPPDTELADLVATRFHTVVAQAYRDGRARLATLAAAEPATARAAAARSRQRRPAGPQGGPLPARSAPAVAPGAKAGGGRRGR